MFQPKYGRPGEINGGHRCYELVFSIHEAWQREECRLLMANEYTLADLHEVIQIMMGWSGRYAHTFEMRDGRRFRTLEDVSNRLMDQAFLDAAGFRLRELKDELDERFAYVYGAHAQWTVLVKRLRTVAVTGHAQAPELLSQPIKTPPEDCVDWAHYESMSSAVKEPESSTYHDALQMFSNHQQSTSRAEINEHLSGVFMGWGML